MTHKGIPSILRGCIWSKFIDSSTLRDQSKYTYVQLLNLSKEQFHLIANYELIINKDINRTLAKHVMFREKNGYGQQQLYRVLRAYAIYDKDIIYCQGMGFICALILNYFEEEDCFWMFGAIIKKFKLTGFLISEMPMLKGAFYKHLSCLKRFLPYVFEHFQNLKLHCSMYSTQWFITLYTNGFPFETLGRVWDMFLHQGMKIIYKIGIAILKLNESTILKLNFEETMHFMKEKMYNEIDRDLLIEYCLKIKITDKYLQELDNELINKPEKSIEDIMNNY